jgi:hypothetical protein
LPFSLAIFSFQTNFFNTLPSRAIPLRMFSTICAVKSAATIAFCLPASSKARTEWKMAVRT